MPKLIDQLKFAFPLLNFIENEPLAHHSPVKIGGPAEVFWQTTTQSDFIDVAKFCIKSRLPFTVIGWGANTLFADKGVKGLIIKNQLNQIEIIKTQPNDIDAVFVKIAAGTPLPSAINYLLTQNIVGLETWARIPSSIGGAIYNNIHGWGGVLLSQILVSVDILDQNGQLQTLNQDQLDLAYDHSRFHHTNEIILAGLFRLAHGDGRQGLSQVKLIAQNKAHHPPISLGCIFQNLDAKTQAKLQLPTNSVGYLIDKVLKLGNLQIGDARVSPKHAAFIENQGRATAVDYLKVITTITQQAKTQLGITLKTEIFYKGFCSTELAGFTTNSDNNNHD